MEGRLSDYQGASKAVQVEVSTLTQILESPFGLTPNAEKWVREVVASVGMNLPTAAEVRARRLKHVESIFHNFAILDRHEAKISKRWLSKSLKKRRGIILDA